LAFSIITPWSGSRNPATETPTPTADPADAIIGPSIAAMLAMSGSGSPAALVPTASFRMTLPSSATMPIFVRVPPMSTAPASRI
jgi:hypothetical protein